MWSGKGTIDRAACKNDFRDINARIVYTAFQNFTLATIVTRRRTQTIEFRLYFGERRRERQQLR